MKHSEDYAQLLKTLCIVGTFNKMLQYTSDIYADLHYQLHRSLRHARQLVVCGYSFGDKGVNTRIIEWVYSSSNRKITVVHPEPEKLKRAARGAILKQWDEWIQQRKLTILTKAIEESSWQDIKNNLFKTG